MGIAGLIFELHPPKGAPRSKIRGQLLKGFWQFLSDLDETWCDGPYGPYFNAGQLKLPDFALLDPKISSRSFP